MQRQGRRAMVSPALSSSRQMTHSPLESLSTSSVMRMLCILLVLFSLLHLSSSVINCRISCRRCREKTDHVELMEVYCAMCNECKERRREWLQGTPRVNIRYKEVDPLQTDHHDSDDCFPSLCEDPCDEPNVLLAASPEPYSVTVTTTTSTTPTSTTRRPCPPKPKCTKPCALPVLPMLPMCSICPGNQIAPATGLNEPTKIVPMEPMYLYLGVPKKLLNELKVEKKV